MTKHAPARLSAGFIAAAMNPSEDSGVGMQTVSRVAMPEGISAETQYLVDQSNVTMARFVEQARERDRALAETRKESEAAASRLMDAYRDAQTLTETELREQLAAAIRSYEGAMTLEGVAQANVDRAQNCCDAADTELNGFLELDREIADFTVQQVKADLHDPLPDHLARAQLQRGQVVDRLDAAHKAHALLAAELKAAQATLAQCSSQCELAATLVIAKRHDAVAAELEVAIDHVVVLRQKLISAGSVWVGGDSHGNPSPLNLSTAARIAIYRQIGEVAPDNAYMAAVRDFHVRLTNDAGAEFQETEPC